MFDVDWISAQLQLNRVQIGSYPSARQTTRHEIVAVADHVHVHDHDHVNEHGP
jgi:hypothetical protein